MQKLVLLALLAVIVSCGEDSTSPNMRPGTPATLISDAAHDLDGNPGFWWLAPMVKQPTVNGTFQAGYSPRVVVVCQAHTGSALTTCDGTTPLVDATGGAAEFTLGAGLTMEGDHFQVQLDTRDFDLRPTTSVEATTYRILAYTESLTELGGPFVLGSADFQIGENGGAARNLADPETMIGLVDGRTLPVKFFINEVAYAHELRAHADANPAQEDAVCRINCSVTVLPAGATGTEASLVDEGGEELTAVQFGAIDETRILVIDERIEEGADADCAPGRDHAKKNCFRYEMSPAGELPEPFRFGVCPVGITFGSGIWQLVQVKADGSATVHGDEDVSDFLPCAGNDGSGGAGSLSFLRPLIDLFAAPLYAEDSRVWGGTARDFSDFFWEVPATMTTTTATGGNAPQGSTKTITVQVVATHPLLHNQPAVGLSGTDVIFEVAEGNGSVGNGNTVGSSITVQTDGNGYASVQHAVGNGANKVVARSPRANNQLAFETTGLSDVLTVTLADDTLVIGGDGVPYTAVMSNATNDSLSVVVLQNYLEQGSTVRAAGGVVVSCGGALGTLPPGSCTEQWAVYATNTGAGTGTLVAGTAVAVVQLLDDGTMIGEARIPVVLQLAPIQ